MSLQVPSFQSAQFASPTINAYAWLAGLSADFGAVTGRVTVNVHPDAASADAGRTPLSQVFVSLGQVLVPATDSAPAVTFPSLAGLFGLAAQIQTANPTNTPDASLKAAIYQSLLLHPLFAGSTQVP